LQFVHLAFLVLLLQLEQVGTTGRSIGRPRSSPRSHGGVRTRDWTTQRRACDVGRRMTLPRIGVRVNLPPAIRSTMA
jgi:hypothetical protein